VGDNGKRRNTAPMVREEVQEAWVRQHLGFLDRIQWYRTRRRTTSGQVVRRVYVLPPPPGNTAREQVYDLRSRRVAMTHQRQAVRRAAAKRRRAS